MKLVYSNSYNRELVEAEKKRQKEAEEQRVLSSIATVYNVKYI